MCKKTGAKIRPVKKIARYRKDGEDVQLNSRIFQNAKWIIGCKIVQSLLQLMVGMLSARYLGPSNYGLINYAASLVAFAVPIMQLGLRSTLVQEYIQNPEKEGELIGTSLVMNLVASMACIIGVTMFSAVANPGEPTTIIVCALYSTSLIAQSVEMLQYWFQAKLLSKYSSLAMVCSYVAVSVYKIYLLSSGKSIYWFAVSYAVEYGATGLILVAAYRKVGTQKLKMSLQTAKQLFAKSKYYIVATLMVVAFNSTSGILLKLLIDERENGFFAAAVTCTGVTTFVYNAVIDTARPVAIESRRQSVEAFEKSISNTYALVTYLSFAQALAFTLFAKLIIGVLYGEDFLPAVPVLQILVWQLAFSIMGSVRNIWILGEEKHHLLWIINLLGAVMNILLNLLMIPPWGACGAAVASVMTQIFANVILGFVIKPIRRNNYLLLKGLNPKLLIKIVGAAMKKTAPKA